MQKCLPDEDYCREWRVILDYAGSVSKLPLLGDLIGSKLICCVVESTRIALQSPEVRRRRKKKDLNGDP